MGRAIAISILAAALAAAGCAGGARADRDAATSGGLDPRGAATTLDALHRAAAEADAEAYFALFAPEAVFLGTDATERWTLDEFREFAEPHFAAGTGWTYRPRLRHIDPLPGGEVIFFDEILDHDRYGECRGSGVLRVVDGRWRVSQYHLTFPIPNDIAAAVTGLIRERGSGAAGLRWVFVVRHAEKARGGGADRDPPLAPEGRARAERLALVLTDVSLSAVFATEFRRTRETVEPAAQVEGIAVRTIPAADTTALIAQLDELPPGSAALVAGHSNTVPEILRALGVEAEIEIGEADYGALFAVRRGLGWAELVRLRF